MSLHATSLEPEPTKKIAHNNKNVFFVFEKLTTIPIVDFFVESYLGVKAFSNISLIFWLSGGKSLSRECAVAQNNYWTLYWLAAMLASSRNLYNNVNDSFKCDKHLLEVAVVKIWDSRQKVAVLRTVKGKLNNTNFFLGFKIWRPAETNQYIFLML